MSDSTTMKEFDETALIMEKEREGKSPIKTILWISVDRGLKLYILIKIINNCHTGLIVHAKLNLICNTVAGGLESS